MAREDLTGTVGDLVRSKELKGTDIEALFDGRTPLRLGDTGYALALPPWGGLTKHVQEVIRSTLLQAKATKVE